MFKKTMPSVVLSVKYLSFYKGSRLFDVLAIFGEAFGLVFPPISLLKELGLANL